MILDNRLLATLNHTMGVTTVQMACSRRVADRYGAYVHKLHTWAESLNAEGRQVSADRLEWVLFRHNGAAQPGS